MKRILVTGANGYIGKNVVHWLVENGYEVLAIDISTDRVDNRAEKIEMNIFEEYKKLLPRLNGIDSCIHLAWRNGFVHNSITHLQDIPLHYEFLKEISKFGIKNINVIGTMHEIGYWEGEINNDTPTNPVSFYGIAKNSLRQSLRVLEREENINLKWLRVFYIQGDDRNNNSIFSKILQKEEEKSEKFPFTTGLNKYDFINIEDLSQMICKASLQKEMTGIINCCSGTAISLKEKVENFLKENNLKIKLEYGVFPDREYDSPEIWGNNDKIKKILEREVK
ncbi:NAD-dependent epimerase/dehydratase family protein [Pseudoleptotrichia goodfellowii]|jgi:cpsJ|uniref:NAD dependent epimerase/dehydratase family protein n=1 Tax=Pseudoleptotrichia goodfellowii F0264 TaxID=596323 RepID=D0GKL5_9FUSO|nr:NAD(P)-dependent oxidoreductase [Pseudoleptotrichia goodfellowii]EEY35364.1 NAD dependent epimerase/dehydratase family protein [Pseudoleptotrichia goodfellowii F0264]